VPGVGKRVWRQKQKKRRGVEDRRGRGSRGCLRVVQTQTHAHTSAHIVVYYHVAVWMRDNQL